MPRGRTIGLVTAVVLGSVVGLGALLQFLAPDLSYHLRDRITELLSGQRGRTFRIALGARAGSNYRIGEALNRYLRANAGYELELLETTSPGNVDSLLGSTAPIDLATINSRRRRGGAGEGSVWTCGPRAAALLRDRGQ